MNKTLLILAAGLGSRYGGGKQTDGFGPNNEMLMEYAVRDARKFGFNRAVFVISRSMEEWFAKEISSRISDVELIFAVQDFSSLPEGFTPPAERVKPYGTIHALVCAQPWLDTPFAVINADDYYGTTAYREMSEELENVKANDQCMVAYPIRSTMSAFGEVTRGLCSVSDDGYLESVAETYRICKCEDGVIRSFTEQGSMDVDPDAIASMNLFGFSPEFARRCKVIFGEFVASLPENDLRSELPLSIVVDRLVRSGEIRMKVRVTDSQWMGVTYKEDKEAVRQRLREIYGDE
ncbi:MAG: nucleotidyltransferase [Ruminococcaceae bacterium]|nr:nucleotidyltransferase [Oscillospiraceae bacterium]